MDFSLANGMISLQVPQTWTRDYSDQFIMTATRDAGQHSDYRLTLSLADVSLRLPKSLEDLHEDNIFDLFATVATETGLESIDEASETTGSGIPVLISVFREIDVEDALNHLLLTAVHDGYACWIHVRGYDAAMDELDNEIEGILQGLSIGT
jgi:hypothetical protein